MRVCVRVRMRVCSAGVRGGAVRERLLSVRVGGRAVERVESQQRGPEGELR